MGDAVGGLFGGGKGSSPEAVKVAKPSATKVEPDLVRARRKRDIKGKQRSLATRQLGEARVKEPRLG